MQKIHSRQIKYRRISSLIYPHKIHSNKVNISWVEFAATRFETSSRKMNAVSTMWQTHRHQQKPFFFLFCSYSDGYWIIQTHRFFYAFSQLVRMFSSSSRCDGIIVIFRQQSNQFYKSRVVSVDRTACCSIVNCSASVNMSSVLTIAATAKFWMPVRSITESFFFSFSSKCQGQLPCIPLNAMPCAHLILDKIQTNSFCRLIAQSSITTYFEHYYRCQTLRICRHKLFGRWWRKCRKFSPIHQKVLKYKSMRLMWLIFKRY